MKKMIIIDVDDDKYTHAKVSLAYKDEEGHWADVNYETYPLRELPRKRETMVYWKSIGGDVIKTYEPTGYDQGYNDAVDEIWGEEE